MLNLTAILGEWRGSKSRVLRERQQIVGNLRNLCDERKAAKRPRAATEIIEQIAYGIERGVY